MNHALLLLLLLLLLTPRAHEAAIYRWRDGKKERERWWEREDSNEKDKLRDKQHNAEGRQLEEEREGVRGTKKESRKKDMCGEGEADRGRRVNDCAPDWGEKNKKIRVKLRSSGGWMEWQIESNRQKRYLLGDREEGGQRRRLKRSRAV